MKHFLLLFVLVLSAAASQPICDPTCKPDAGSATYASLIQARPKIQHARGVSSVQAPMVKTKGAANLIGSQSFSTAFPILSLPGRNGLDLNLTLFYNSQVWLTDGLAGLVLSASACESKNTTVSRTIEIKLNDRSNLRAKKEEILREILWNHWRSQTPYVVALNTISKEGIKSKTVFDICRDENNELVIRVSIRRSNQQKTTDYKVYQLERKENGETTLLVLRDQHGQVIVEM